MKIIENIDIKNDKIKTYTTFSNKIDYIIKHNLNTNKIKIDKVYKKGRRKNILNIHINKIYIGIHEDGEDKMSNSYLLNLNGNTYMFIYSKIIIFNLPIYDKLKTDRFFSSKIDGNGRINPILFGERNIYFLSDFKYINNSNPKSNYRRGYIDYIFSNNKYDLTIVDIMD